MVNRLGLSGSILIVGLFVSVGASADGSSASFQPATSADAANIHQQGIYLWNQSTTSSASVVANLGVLRTVGESPYSVNIFGNTAGNGATIQCTLTANSLTSAGFRYSVTMNVAPAAAGDFDTDISLVGPLSPTGAPYATQLFCTLSPLQPSFGAEQIWGYEDAWPAS